MAGIHRFFFFFFFLIFFSSLFFRAKSDPGFPLPPFPNCSSSGAKKVFDSFFYPRTGCLRTQRHKWTTILFLPPPPLFSRVGAGIKETSPRPFPFPLFFFPGKVPPIFEEGFRSRGRQASSLFPPFFSFFGMSLGRLSSSFLSFVPPGPGSEGGWTNPGLVRLGFLGRGPKPQENLVAPRFLFFLPRRGPWRKKRPLFPFFFSLLFFTARRGREDSFLLFLCFLSFFFFNEVPSFLFFLVGSPRSEIGSPFTTSHLHTRKFKGRPFFLPFFHPFRVDLKRVLPFLPPPLILWRKGQERGVTGSHFPPFLFPPPFFFFFCPPVKGRSR